MGVDAREVVKALVGLISPDLKDSLTDAEAEAVSVALTGNLTGVGDFTPALSFQDRLAYQKEIVDGLSSLLLRIQRDDGSTLGRQLLLFEISTTIEPKDLSAIGYVPRIELELHHAKDDLHLEFREVRLKDVIRFEDMNGDPISIDGWKFQFYWQGNLRRQLVRSKGNGELEYVLDNEELRQRETEQRRLEAKVGTQSGKAEKKTKEEIEELKEEIKSIKDKEEEMQEDLDDLLLRYVDRVSARVEPGLGFLDEAIEGLDELKERAKTAMNDLGGSARELQDLEKEAEQATKRLRHGRVYEGR
jgi:hypothetical protein